MFFIQRTFPYGVTSCAGPYASRVDASRSAASRYMPDQIGPPKLLDRAREPITTPARHLIVRWNYERSLNVLGGRVGTVIAGPFVSRREAKRFLTTATGCWPHLSGVEIASSSPRGRVNWHKDARVAL